ncbi:hypothetical protein BJV82DRAFT_609666 [Fennellomyces sp. T-0311]|nr:hypothetical protein BJV82DRAFT_609666 [Fennellomyces sp. T-0311]
MRVISRTSLLFKSTPKGIAKGYLQIPEPTITQKLTIEALPDELITHILVHLQADLKTLCEVAQASPRLQKLAMDVLRDYILPNIQLGTIIDQEGRRKATTFYMFDSLDNDTMQVRFKPVMAVSQRYRNDGYAAPPTLHRLSMSVNTSTLPVKESNSRRQASWHTLDSLTNLDEASKTQAGKPRQLRISKPGIFSAQSNSSLWQLEYRVSTDHSASTSATDSSGERFVSPLFVKAHLSLFWRISPKKQSSPVNVNLLQWIKKSLS